MNFLKAIILGIVQGLTEFLPISSSGHLVIGARILGFEEPGIAFEVFLHLGTLMSVIYIFRRELREMILAPLLVLQGRESVCKLSQPLAWDFYIILATLPAVFVGLLLKDSIDRIFGSMMITFGFLAVSGLIMWLTSFLSQRDGDVNSKRALAMGMAQAMAIMPGLSRSGSTIFTGMALGVGREKAARFSFMMSIPAILGAVVLKTKDLIADPPNVGELIAIACGTVAAAVSGYFSIILLLSIIRRGKLQWFGYYCFLVSGIGFTWYFLQ